MHSVANVPPPDFLDRRGSDTNEFEEKYRNDDASYFWDLSTEDHKRLIKSLVGQFGPQVKTPPRFPGRDYSVVGICAYCERDCDIAGGDTKNEIEHFRPRSRYNSLMFEWLNLLYVCHRCNHNKKCKFPDGGYVNPREPDAETFFVYDLTSGEIKPNPSLPDDMRAKASRTIIDLDLHSEYLNSMRIGQYALLMKEFTNSDKKRQSNIIKLFQDPRAPFSSFIRAKFHEDKQHMNPVSTK